MLFNLQMTLQLLSANTFSLIPVAFSKLISAETFAKTSVCVLKNMSTASGAFTRFHCLHLS